MELCFIIALALCGSVSSGFGFTGCKDFFKYTKKKMNLGTKWLYNETLHWLALIMLHVKGKQINFNSISYWNS